MESTGGETTWNCAPDTGRCVEGPYPGARLKRLAVARRGDELVVGA